MATDMEATTEDTMENGKYARQDQEDDRIDIAIIIDGMWKGILRYWWLFLALISVCSSISCLYARHIHSPQYSAYSTFTVRATTSYGYNEEK